MALERYQRGFIWCSGSRVAITGGYRYTMNVPLVFQGVRVLIDEVIALKYEASVSDAKSPREIKFSDGSLVKTILYPLGDLLPGITNLIFSSSVLAGIVLGATMVIDVLDVDGDISTGNDGAVFNGVGSAGVMLISVLMNTEVVTPIVQFNGVLPVSIAQTVSTKDVNFK